MDSRLFSGPKGQLFAWPRRNAWETHNTNEKRANGPVICHFAKHKGPDLRPLDRYGNASPGVPPGLGKWLALRAEDKSGQINLMVKYLKQVSGSAS